MPAPRILITGGSGLLGSQLKKLLPEADYPSHSDFDVTDPAGMSAHLDRNPADVILHAAAFTSPPAVEEDPIRALDVNLVGTANVVRICSERSIRLVYVSTDYVFRGDRGNYREDDSLAPVNRYAWSKLGGECAAILYDRALIVRTSFGPNEFPYPKALVDQWTSRESVRSIADKLAAILCGPPVFGVMHLGGPRRTVYEFAKSLGPDKEIGEMSINDLPFTAPEDTSLDCRRFEEWSASELETAK